MLEVLTPSLDLFYHCVNSLYQCTVRDKFICITDETRVYESPASTPVQTSVTRALSLGEYDDSLIYCAHPLMRNILCVLSLCRSPSGYVRIHSPQMAVAILQTRPLVALVAETAHCTY